MRMIPHAPVIDFAQIPKIAPRLGEAEVQPYIRRRMPSTTTGMN